MFASVSCRIALLLALLCLCAVVAGCGVGEKPEEPSNLRSLAVYYNQYRAKHRGQSPANEKDFKDFIAKSGGKSTPDILLTSIRDGKPFVIKYRDNKSWPLADVIAYEQDGHNGSRDVVTVAGGYKKIPDEEFQKQMSAVAAKR